MKRLQDLCDVNYDLKPFSSDNLIIDNSEIVPVYTI